MARCSGLQPSVSLLRRRRTRPLRLLSINSMSAAAAADHFFLISLIIQCPRPLLLHHPLLLLRRLHRLKRMRLPFLLLLLLRLFRFLLSVFLLQRDVCNVKPADEEVLQPEQNFESAAAPTSIVHRSATGFRDKSCKDRLHIYKNLLQQFAQKQNLGVPVYTCEAEGPPHARRFKSRVTFAGKTYETLEFFSTLKEAEQYAAKVACEVLSVDVDQEDPSLYKNLLQEVA